jgi:hypothetical protein
MKTLLITKFERFPELPSPLTGLPLLDFTQLIIRHKYNIYKFIQDIHKENSLALLRDAIYTTKQSATLFIFGVIREIQRLKKDITVIPSDFLTNKEINYLVDVLHNKVNILFVTIKKNKVLFVNPYNANYFIYDAFTSSPLGEIIEQLVTPKSRDKSKNKKRNKNRKFLLRKEQYDSNRII